MTNRDAEIATVQPWWIC